MAAEQLLTSLRYDTNLLDCAPNTRLGPTDDNDNGRPTPFYMLAYHHDRLVTSATRLGWSQAAAIPALSSIASFEASLLAQLQSQASQDDAIPTPQRIRVLLDQAGTLTVQAFPTTPVPLSTLFPATIPCPLRAPSEAPRPLRIYLDSHCTKYPLSKDLSNADAGRDIPKTTSRSHYTSARARFSLAPTDVESDVLLFVSGAESLGMSSQDCAITETTISNVLFWRSVGESRGRWITPDIRADGGIEGVVRRFLLENGLCEMGTVRMGEVVDGEEVWVCNGVRGVRRGVIVKK